MMWRRLSKWLRNVLARGPAVAHEWRHNGIEMVRLLPNGEVERRPATGEEVLQFLRENGV
jgi:hypothetical protein